MDYSQYIKENAEKINEEHIREVLSKEDEIKIKLKKLGGENPEKWKYKINLMMEWLEESAGTEEDKFDREKINLIALALLYFIRPVDFIPDAIPLIGYMDDMAILNNIWEKVEMDLLNYAEKKGGNLKLFFNL